MSQHTDIQWADSTVNPTTGCDGCELWKKGVGGPCYAGNLHEGRLAKSMPALYSPDFGEVRLAPGRMTKAAAWSDLTGKPRPDKPWLDGRPRVIFVEDMGDLFSKAVPFDYIKSEVFDIATGPKGSRHIYMLLTKQPSRMLEFSRWLWREHGLPWPANLWAGASITGPKTLRRLDAILGVPAMVRFLSIEPMLDSLFLGLSEWQQDGFDEAPYRAQTKAGQGLSLVIVGGESGPEARPFYMSDARSVRDECAEANVAFFLKQIGARPIEDQPDDGPEWPIPLEYANSGFIEPRLRDSHGGDWNEWPEDLRVRQFPEVPHAS